MPTLRGRRYSQLSKCWQPRALWQQAVTFVSLTALILATMPGEVYAQSYTPVFYYHYGDHLGSSNVMTDRPGVLVQHYEYSAFGKETHQNNTSVVRRCDRAPLLLRDYAITSYMRNTYFKLSKAMTRWLNKVLKTSAYCGEVRNVKSFTRDSGVCCFSVTRFFSDPKVVQDLPSQLLSSELVWYWDSERRMESDSLPDSNSRFLHESVRKLASENSEHLTQELLERDDDGYGRAVILMGAVSEIEKAQT